MVMEKPKLPGNGRFRSNNRDRRFESILLRQTVVETPDFFLKGRSGLHNLVRTAVALKIAAYSFLGSARDDFKKR